MNPSSQITKIRNRCGPLGNHLYELFCHYLATRSIPTFEDLENYNFRPAKYLKAVYVNDDVNRRIKTLGTFKKWAKKLELKKVMLFVIYFEVI